MKFLVFAVAAVVLGAAALRLDIPALMLAAWICAGMAYLAWR